MRIGERGTMEQKCWSDADCHCSAEGWGTQSDGQKGVGSGDSGVGAGQEVGAVGMMESTLGSEFRDKCPILSPLSDKPCSPRPP